MKTFAIKENPTSNGAAKFQRNPLLLRGCTNPKTRTSYKMTVLTSVQICDQLSFPSRFLALIRSILIKRTREDGQNPCDHFDIRLIIKQRYQRVSLTHFLCSPMPEAERSSFHPLSAGLVVLLSNASHYPGVGQQDHKKSL